MQKKDYLVKKSKLKEIIRGMGLGVSEEAIDLLNSKMMEVISTASIRARNNGRKRIQARDL